MIGRPITEMDTGYPHVYKSELMRGYDANNARVREVVPMERLLIQDHSKGWKGLTDFLGRDMPEESYPHSNTREDFMAMFRRMGYQAAGAVLFCLVVVILFLRVLIWFCAGGVKKKVD